MYDMYPDWGPANTDHDGFRAAAVQAALDLRDNGGRAVDDG